jgi:hypothetical protein
VVGLALTAGTLRAQHAPAAATYLGNEITKVVQTEQDRFFLVKLDLALRAPAHRWYAVDVEFRLQQAQPLMLPHGKLLMRRWDNLFTPDQKSAVHWSDIRVDVDFSLLEQASNLPREQTFPIWVMGVLWDHANNRYVGSGWSARTALLVTTDAGGKISHAEPLDVLPQPKTSKQPSPPNAFGSPRAICSRGKACRRSGLCPTTPRPARSCGWTAGRPGNRRASGSVSTTWTPPKPPSSWSICSTPTPS